MSSAIHVAERSAEIARILETESDLKAFQQHLEEILHGQAFRGSHRSGQFLSYVVNQSINGRCDELKERLIGIELFGRLPSYDTGEDAIVRCLAQVSATTTSNGSTAKSLDSTRRTPGRPCRS